MEITEKSLAFVKDRYQKKFNTLDTFTDNYKLYLELKSFKACENFHEKFEDTEDPQPDIEHQYINDEHSLKPEIHWIMRMFTQYYLTESFTAMKIDLDDPNTQEQSLGKGTPGRIAKMWLGNDPEDITELGSGRWNKQPYISRFPNTDKNHSIITKEVDVVSCCSHHFIPFSTFNNGKAVIEYIPNKYVLGISKLQRFVTWASRRFWLQEDLTQYLGKTIMRIAATADVHIKLENLVHGCETFRGAQAKNGSLTTEFKSGIFKNK